MERGRWRGRSEVRVRPGRIRRVGIWVIFVMGIYLNPVFLSVSKSNEPHPRENRTGEYGDCPDVIHQISGGDLPVDNAASS